VECVPPRARVSVVMSNYLEIPQTPRAKTPSYGDQALTDSTGRKIGQDGGPFDHRRPSGSVYSDDGTVHSLRSDLEDVVHVETVARPRLLPSSLHRFWVKHRPVLLVFSAQLFGALMNLCARLLELEPGHKMHPFQILFLRMSVTTLCSIAYMHWKKIPHAPLGMKEVRWLLVFRGCSGFFGLYGMWYSMMYIPLAEATVITFLVPSAAGYICHLVLHDPFTRKEQIASFIALAGVILIAKPTSLFSLGAQQSHATPAHAEAPTNSTVTESIIGNTDNVSPTQRLIAIGVALLGVLGGSGAFTAIRWIGTRAYPLISVTYFSMTGTIVSTTVLALAPLLDISQPELHFGLPHSPRQWAYLFMVCICGFTTQFLLTAGLGAEKSNRATAMVSGCLGMRWV
jgi:drug/metabolite transporter (DMT)-like permease